MLTGPRTAPTLPLALALSLVATERARRAAQTAPTLAQVKAVIDGQRASPEARALQAKRSAAKENAKRHAERRANGEWPERRSGTKATRTMTTSERARHGALIKAGKAARRLTPHATPATAQPGGQS